MGEKGDIGEKKRKRAEEERKKQRHHAAVPNCSIRVTQHVSRQESLGAGHHVLVDETFAAKVL